MIRQLEFPSGVRLLARWQRNDPDAIEQLVSWGGQFDRSAADDLLLAMEGGHSVGRIIHANGDQTGAEIQRLLIGKAMSMKRPRRSVRHSIWPPTVKPEPRSCRMRPLTRACSTN